jgi:hypothetical protein
MLICLSQELDIEAKQVKNYLEHIINEGIRIDKNYIEEMLEEAQLTIEKIKQEII